MSSIKATILLYLTLLLSITMSGCMHVNEYKALQSGADEMESGSSTGYCGHSYTIAEHYGLGFASVEVFSENQGHMLNIVRVHALNSYPFHPQPGGSAFARERRINDIVIEALTSWIVESEQVKENVLARLPNTIQIFNHSPRYLSFLSFFENYPDPTRGHFPGISIWDFITIDVQSQQRVFLHDLIDVNDEFVNHLKTQDIARAIVGHFTGDAFDFERESENLWLWFEEMSFDEMRERIEEMSLTMQEAGIYRNNFYIEPGRLMMMFHHSNWVAFFAICIDDIACFLLVDPW